MLARLLRRLVSSLTGEGDYLWRIERLDLTRYRPTDWIGWEAVEWNFPRWSNQR